MIMSYLKPDRDSDDGLYPLPLRAQSQAYQIPPTALT